MELGAKQSLEGGPGATGENRNRDRASVYISTDHVRHQTRQAEGGVGKRREVATKPLFYL